MNESINAMEGHHSFLKRTKLIVKTKYGGVWSSAQYKLFLAKKYMTLYQMGRTREYNNIQHLDSYNKDMRSC